MRFALVTGATSGLGAEIAKTLIKDGWYVFACGRNKQALAEFEKIKNAHPLEVDVTSEESIEKAYQEVCSETNRIDALINFSGVQKMSSLVEGDIKIVEQMVEVNLMGMVRMNKAFFPLVKHCNGRIINCSSECGWMTPQPFNGPYTLSKYAVEAYNDSLRRELMFLDIPVIKIQPGSFKTAMHNSATSSFDKLINGTVLYRDVLEKMKGMMVFELKMANDPKYLVDAVMKAVNDPNPKQKYRVKNSPLLGLVEILNPYVVDGMYKKVLKSSVMGKLFKKLEN